MNAAATQVHEPESPVDTAVEKMRETLTNYEKNVRTKLDKLKQSGRFRTIPVTTKPDGEKNA